MDDYGPPERVYVENDWYDGPRAGIADVDGRPHRFKSVFHESADEYLETFLVWPIDENSSASRSSNGSSLSNGMLDMKREKRRSIHIQRREE